MGGDSERTPEELQSDEDEVAPGSSRERVIRRRLRRKTTVDTQAATDTVEDWRVFDVKKCMRMLHSPDPTVVRKALMRLHVRWFHCPAQMLTNTLRAARAPASAVSEIPKVTQACNICSNWKKPGPRNIHFAQWKRSTKRFNST